MKSKFKLPENRKISNEMKSLLRKMTAFREEDRIKLQEIFDLPEY
jgi:hypothetical protein